MNIIKKVQSKFLWEIEIPSALMPACIHDFQEKIFVIWEPIAFAP